ncbi:YdeI/OmpD-associated family protein [Altererythrobacter sp. Z27]|uniref:YdeI/OmpD-associated family protein n=1 Tax=Altererythrobacter sp. Z27 TaxID=3461147 RepID=UPI00404514FE
MPADPRIDAYIAKAAPFARPILSHIRTLVHRALPDVEEGIKWSMPTYMIGGKNLVSTPAFKAHAGVVIHGEGRAGGAMGSLGKLVSLDDLPSNEDLMARFKAGRDALGKPRPKRAPKPELAVPPEFAKMLASSPKAQETFANFGPSHRREYIEWVSGAKREETRAKRMEQALQWLAEGKKRNWKYENC